MIEKKKIVVTVSVLLSLCLPVFAFAEVITLKSGKTVEGKIIERADEYIKVDFYGAMLTYYFDEIKSINGGDPSISLADGKISGTIVENKDSLFALSTGNIWNYQGGAFFSKDKNSPVDLGKGLALFEEVKIVGKDKIDDKEVLIMEMYGGNDENNLTLELRKYLAEAGQSLLCYRREIYVGGEKKYDKTFIPPQEIAKLDAKPGDKWDLLDGSTIEFSGISQVDTPAGKFNAYKFVIAAFSNGEESYTHKFYVPRIGLAQEITVMKEKERNTGIELKLTNYRLTGKN